MNQTTLNIEYLVPVFAGTLLFALLIAFIIYFILLYRKSQVKFTLERERLKQELLHIENEVKEQTLIHVSRELHDNLGQVASLIKINLNMMSDSLNAEDTERINDSLVLLKQMIGDIKTLSASLKGDNIREKGWVNLIYEDFERLNKQDKVDFSVDTEGDLTLDPEKEVILYRIYQEILNNTIKHADATSILLSIVARNGFIYFVFSDDGIGFDLQQVNKGSGLTNIQERCQMIGAQLEIRTEPNQGTEIEIRLNSNNGD